MQPVTIHVDSSISPGDVPGENLSFPLVSPEDDPYALTGDVPEKTSSLPDDLPGDTPVESSMSVPETTSILPK
jgi:hypothetical protein